MGKCEREVRRKRLLTSGVGGTGVGVEGEMVRCWREEGRLLWVLCRLRQGERAKERRREGHRGDRSTASIEWDERER